jgi:hypothetical protein
VKPPQADIDKMLARGQFGIIVSICCLAAATAVLRGEDPAGVELLDMGGLDQFTAADLALLKATIVKIGAQFATDPPESLPYSIALYREHLKQAGYNVEEGMSN